MLPRHKHFLYFTSLVDAYRKIIDEDHPSVTYAECVLKNDMALLERCLARLEFEREEQRKEIEGENKEGDAASGLKIQSEIDWHDFVVVDTIQFDDDTLDTKAFGNMSTPHSSTILHGDSVADEAELLVRTDYVPQIAEAPRLQKTTVLPDGRLMSADQVNEHMRIEHMDPRYLEQKTRFWRSKWRLTCRSVI